MKNLKMNDSQKNLISIMVSSAIPSLVGYLFFLFKNNDPSPLSSIISVAASLIAFFMFYYILPLFKCFRPFAKYEGIWLQIIPDSNRPLSIIHFRYKKAEQQYELIGFNFMEDCETGIEFIAHKFVRRDYYSGFYYITNHTWEQKNGLGKIGFISNNIDGLTRAEGYFFDASNDTCAKKLDTIMIKCDKKFFRFIDPSLSNVNYKQIPEKNLAKMSWDFAQKKIKKYRHMHDLNEKVGNSQQSTSKRSIKIEGDFNIVEE